MIFFHVKIYLPSFWTQISSQGCINMILYQYDQLNLQELLKTLVHWLTIFIQQILKILFQKDQ